MRRAASTINILPLVLLAGVALAEQIPNWAAPSTWTPLASAMTGKAGSKTGLVTTYNALPFIPVTPCRMADTRAGSGFSGQWGPPAIPGGGTQRNFTITGQCGIPTGAQAVSFNFAVWGPPTRGDLRVFPAGAGTPLASTMNWEAGILALANAAVVALGAGGAITVQVDGAGTVDLFFDVNGYYSPDVSQTSSGGFYISTNQAYYGAIVGSNSNPLGYGVRGFGTGIGTGVYGTSSGSGAGVNGGSVSGVGVYGSSTGGNVAGVLGVNNTATNGTQGVGGYAGGAAKVFGVQGQIASGATAGSAGVHGIGAATAGVSYGVLGEALNTVDNSAGVFGRDGHGAGAVDGWSAGVRGEGKNGVLGVSDTFGGFGDVGAFLDSGGSILAMGFLGGNFGSPLYGVYSYGDFGASGTKTFVEPHPVNAGQVIRFVCLEGPESGTYFRGRGTFSGGVARIEVPESFRMVTDPDGLTVQITPIGRMASVGVTRLSLDGIEAEASRDVEFSYLVQGVRKAYKNFSPIAEGNEFMPRGPGEKMPSYLSEEARKRLVANGTYNADGSVNMGTAERLGWTEKWREVEKARTRPGAPER